MLLLYFALLEAAVGLPEALNQREDSVSSFLYCFSVIISRFLYYFCFPRLLTTTIFILSYLSVVRNKNAAAPQINKPLKNRKEIFTPQAGISRFSGVCLLLWGSKGRAAPWPCLPRFGSSGRFSGTLLARKRVPITFRCAPSRG